MEELDPSQPFCLDQHEGWDAEGRDHGILVLQSPSVCPGCSPLAADVPSMSPGDTGEMAGGHGLPPALSMQFPIPDHGAGSGTSWPIAFSPWGIE